MASTTSATALDPFITDYLAHQRALGRTYNAEERVLHSLRDFVDDARAHDLNLLLFERWCATHASLTGNVRRGRQRVVRNFCLYRQRRDPACFIPDPNRFPRRNPYCTPVIVAPEAIGRMLDAADQVRASPDSPLRPHVLRLATALLYSTGLRRGELLRLQLGDIDAKAGVLRVRESKFHKSRWVPLSADAAIELRRYLRHRMQLPGCTGPATPLLCHGVRTAHGYTGTGLSAGLHALMDAADVRGWDGRRPRLHDMRHTFAVQCLLRWYRQGADVQSNLPKLAMYMGHVSIESTAYYLRWIPELARAASDRFESAYGQLITTEVAS